MEKYHLRDYFHPKTFYLLIAVSALIVLIFISFLSWSWRDVVDDYEHAQDSAAEMLLQTTQAIFTSQESLLATVGYELINLNADIEPSNGRAYIDNIQAINPSVAGFSLARIDGQLMLMSNASAGETLPDLLENPETARSFWKTLEKEQLVSGRNYYHRELADWVMPMRAPIKDETGLVTAVMLAGFRLQGEGLSWGGMNIPVGIQVRLLRTDGYWQYIQGLAPGAMSQAYLTAEPPSLYNQIAALASGREQSADILFVGETHLITAKPVPKYGLYSVAITPFHVLVQAWWSRISFVVLIMLLVVGCAGVYLRIAVRTLQQSKMLAEQAEHQLYLRANYSAITDLPNRTYSHEILRRLLMQAKAAQSSLIIAHIDIDNFKDINDSFGQRVGNRALSTLAHRLKEMAGSDVTMGHLGGDEFLMVWHQNAAQFDDFIAQLKALNPSYLTINQQSLYLSVCVGVARYPQHGMGASQLLNCAGLALHSAKQKGRASVLEFEVEQAAKRSRELQLEQYLQVALQKQSLSVHYQPKYHLGESRPYGFEALVRWHSDELGDVSPAEFIPIAERSGLINRVGAFVLSKALDDVAYLRSLSGSPLTVSVNVSVPEVMQHTLVSRVEQELKRVGLPAEALELELTESLLAEDVTLVTAELDQLKSLGVSIAIDDFGTGYSSMSYLSQIPCDRLKIDRAFVHRVHASAHEGAITKAIIALGHSLDMKVIAEGVESVGQFNCLQQLGCDEVQGFLLAKPLPLDQLIQWQGFDVPLCFESDSD